MSLTFAPWEPVVPDESTVTVKEVRAYVIGDKKLEEKVVVELTVTLNLTATGSSIHPFQTQCQFTPCTKGPERRGANLFKRPVGALMPSGQ